MLKGAIARRYAGAIFEIALKQNTLDRSLDDIQNIAQVFANRTLSYLLREPKVPAQRKETVLRETLAPRVLPTSLNLALLIVQRGLVEIMPHLASEFEQFVLDYRNQAIAEVTTATQIDEAQGSVVRQALEQRTGKSIKLQTRIDPSILGGVIARVGDQIIDNSVRNRLHVLQQQLLAGIGANDEDFDSSEDSNQPVATA
jgi:F-type H+-transporting ATPase subunit delta